MRGSFCAAEVGGQRHVNERVVANSIVGSATSHR
jgi:hypothetical protein